MSDPYVLEWLRAFALTQVIELAVYALILPASRPRRERLAIGFGASAITHPLVWFVIPALMQLIRPCVAPDLEPRVYWWVTVAVSEAFAFGAEAGWMRAFGLSWPRAALASGLANGASFTVGLVCYKLLGW